MGEYTTTPPAGDAAHEKGQQCLEKQTNQVHGEDGSADALENDTRSKEPEGITGLQLFILLGSLTLVIFLMMMDMSIVSTVNL